MCDNMPNAETIEAIEEIKRMRADPTIGKTYSDVDEMMRELLSDTDDALENSEGF